MGRSGRCPGCGARKIKSVRYGKNKYYVPKHNTMRDGSPCSRLKSQEKENIYI
jgi:hypothetical protein